MPPENDECPSECPKGEAKNTFCETCPVKEAKENFKEFAVEELDLKCQGWKKYGFDSLLHTVLDVGSIQDSPSSTWTITTARLVQILTHEKNRLERIERWNNRKPDS